MHLVRLAIALPLAAALAGCAAGDPVEREPASMRVVCGAGDLIGCFEQPSRLCGPAGYDLFDEQGRRVSVSDARYGPVIATCRTPDAPRR